MYFGTNFRTNESMKRYHLLLAIVPMLVLAMGSCKVKTNMENTNANVPAILIGTAHTPAFNDAFSIESAWIDKDVLHCVVSYSGGCSKHEFALHSNGMYMKSMPPQLNVRLHHQSNGDACRELITDSLSFQINEARYPGNKYGKVILRLESWEGSLEYLYPEGE